ncbi:ComEC/Rec2 family competence protein [Candidatus Poribacteria bacterium]
MDDLLEVTMLPGQEGDCLQITYGQKSDKKYILIDGGRKWTYENSLQEVLGDSGISELELLVITHVDRDHIDGVMALCKDDALQLHVKDVWFNTYDHLRGRSINPPANDGGLELEPMGPKMGEALSDLLIKREWPWNNHFGGHAIELRDDPSDNVLKIGDATLTILSPDRDKLQAFIPTWKKECEEEGLVPGVEIEEHVADDDHEEMGANERYNIESLASIPFEEDDSKANGSSIAFLLEFKGKRILFAGDAHADIIQRELENLLAPGEKKIKLDAFKIPHHGSSCNISEDLLDLVDCDHFLISTNGSYYKHPDPAAMARIIKFGGEKKTLHFNFSTKYTECWDKSRWKRQYKYDVSYPDDDNEGRKSLVLIG